MIRVLIADDQALVRTGFRVILDAEPDLDWIEATRRIAQSGGTAHVLILTTFDLDEYVYEALRAGGFLLKDAGADELMHAVRVVAYESGLVQPGESA